jgi:hypothetical protein
MPFKLKEIVHDSWWPWMLGIIVKINKSSVYVKQSDGQIVRYDKAHQRFLKHGL